MRLQEADYSMTAQAMDPLSGIQANHDQRLKVTFGLFPEIDQAESEKEARPIFKDAEYIQIMVPGERDIVHRKVWKRDIERFPLHYAAFKNKQSQDLVSGTPLKLMPWITGGQAKELEYFNCSTVEQLANMPDSLSSKFIQIQKLKQLAKDYLQAAKEQAPLVQMRAELDKRDNEIEVLKRQMAELMARATAAEAD